MNLLALLLTSFLIIPSDSAVYFRINQLGYFPNETKKAILFSKTPVETPIELWKDNDLILREKARSVTIGNWGTFEYYYEFDFSKIKEPGSYHLKSGQSDDRSQAFSISNEAFGNHQESLLEFMRQQRCGYNPTLDVYCHQKDGLSFYGSMPDSSKVDISGGWHDAGDQLKYLITSSYATAHMLKTYELYPEKFADQHDAMGRKGKNGIPDILDEAKWGLDWLIKAHPNPDDIIHQVADDRDHRGFKMPDNDNSDYGWGQNSYRPAYFADGKPQGLNKYKSQATGVSNLAGRCAAAFAMAARLWTYDAGFAKKCKQMAISVYELGRKKEGYQQGNSYGAPYRYNEDTWNDDMEWGAAELFKLTKEASYLEQAKVYALKSSNADSWMVLDTADHYRLYPFINMGHFVLHEFADKKLRTKLEGFYKEGIEYTIKRGQRNPFEIGVPFIWCSNNLVTSLAAQVILFQKMTKSHAYNDFLIAQRDWLFGRNPWGTSMFSGIPAHGEFPTAVHTSLYILKNIQIPGGLVDGPVYMSIYKSLIGIKLTEPDEFAAFQNNHVTYHDDTGDYSTNEPTMDGTAGALLMMAHWGKGSREK
jgi:endoglucanase